MDRNTTRWSSSRIVLCVTALIVLTFSLSVKFTPVRAVGTFDTSLCGNGSAPDYGFTDELQQAHWTVDWQDYASEQTVNEVDTVLDQLNADSIVQTMILIKPQDQVGNRVNCAVHFLRYMKLGLPAGERKDNGFVFLIVIEPARIDVHYGVGLGLPALTAHDLTDLNRLAESTYQATNSLDQVLIALVQGFDRLTRSKYPPLISPTPSPETIELPALPAGPLGIVTICCLSCIGIFILLFLLWLFIQLARIGITSNSSGSGGGGFPSGRGWGRPSSRGGGWSRPASRGGSGSGRSGRGN